MTVVFKTNLGSMDAKKFGLDHKECVQGATVDVSEDAATALKDAGIAVSPEEAKTNELIQSSLGVSKEDFAKSQEKPAKRATRPEPTPPK